VEKLRSASFGIGEERVAWEGLASSCAPPFRRLGAFALVGFTAWVTLTTAVVLAYNLFGAQPVPGGGVAVPEAAFYATMLASFGVAAGGFLVWVYRSRRSYDAFAAVLRRGGLDHRHPTARGLRVYSDEQLLALRSRYEKLREGKVRRLLEETFGFRGDDGFSLGPLSVLPKTFEMGALRIVWEANLILAGNESRPEITWWTECRHALLPRQSEGTRKLLFALRYTGDSVRELKRRYGYRADRWHATVPEGKLFDAVRDYEEAQRLQTALYRHTRVGRG
jgi:hypothetical protein